RCSTPALAWTRSTRSSSRWRSASATASSCARTTRRTGASSPRCGRSRRTSKPTAPEPRHAGHRPGPDGADGGGLRRLRAPGQRHPGRPLCPRRPAFAGGDDAGRGAVDAPALGLARPAALARGLPVAVPGRARRPAAAAGAGGFRGGHRLALRAQPALAPRRAHHPDRGRARRLHAGHAGARARRLQPRPHPGLGGRAGRAGAGQPGAGDGGRARRPARPPRPARPRLHHPRAVVAVRQHLQLRHRRRVLRGGVRLPQAPFPGPLRQLRRLRAPDGGARARVLARFPALNGRRGARIGYASPMQQRVDSMDVAESALQRLAWGVHNVLGFAFTLAWTAGWISLALLVLGLTRRRALALRMAARCWAPGLLTGAGARLVVEGAERVDWSRPHLLVANHQSVIDICALFRAVPVPLHFLLKQEMTRVPFVGWYARACGMLFIERDNARAGARMRRE